MKRMLTLVLVLFVAGMLLVPRDSTAANPRSGGGASVQGKVHPSAVNGTGLSSLPVTGLVGTAGSFIGTLNIQRFAFQNGQLVAIGTLTGTLRDATGKSLGSVTNRAVTLPVTTAQAACRILHLELGPIYLNLLGLVVRTNRIVVDITAVPGPGNLLGNLLCSVAHLLDNTSTTPTQLVAVLNRILAILR